VVDLGSGVNSQIIVTSTFWRFEFFSGVILLTLILPLNYFLIKEFGIIGAGYSDFISLTIYNVIRIVFLKRKFNIHPFTNKTVTAVIIAFVCYGICYYTFQNFHGFLGIVLKGSVFTVLYGGAIVYFNLSPDVLPVFETIKKRAGLGSKQEF
jgi:O-antigen/teichoic acid export membrane protein